jgi:predicted phosphodiesterase
MLVAVLSDIHSNVYALQAVIRDVEIAAASEIWICGDTFGYYPWPAETFALLEGVRPMAILGNHDSWITDIPAAPRHVMGEIARHNERELASRAPDALAWLASLPDMLRFERNGWTITMTHGTPDNPMEGRYYPDDAAAYSWLPRVNEVLILGQTHYPLVRGRAKTGLVLNPGSVGQPRDLNPMPSWALLDLAAGSAELRRTVYDNIKVMDELRALGWNEPVTRALDKREVGS